MVSRDVCSVDGCIGLVHARGWCQKHYRRIRKYGVVDLPLVPDAATGEEWRNALSFAGYLVSNQGRVYSIPRPSTPGGMKPQYLDPRGYRRVNLSLGGRVKSKLVHQLVAATFVGPRPSGLEVRHLDGNSLNNGVANLTYGTRAENMQDKLAHGTNWQLNKTHCPQGHLYDVANTLVTDTPASGNRRTCRRCKDKKDYEYRQQNRELIRQRNREYRARRRTRQIDG